MTRYKIAVLDDYQNVALSYADWTPVSEYADVEIFSDHLHEPEQVISRLLPFDIVCVMRERTPLPAEILSKLSNLKLIVSTGFRNASIDTKAAGELGIEIINTGYRDHGALELTWALLMAIAKHIPQENANFRAGGWQQMVGGDLKGKTLGVLGLGNLGSKIAGVAKVFDMNVIAWSQNLTEEKAAAAGVKYVDKETLFRESDYLTILMVLSDRSRGIVAAGDLDLMKPTAYLINTSRGPLVDEEALIKALTEKRIAGAALDVFDKEPLDADHPFRKLSNVLATPHIGFVTEDTYHVFFTDMVNSLLEWFSSKAV